LEQRKKKAAAGDGVRVKRIGAQDLDIMRMYRKKTDW